MMELKEELIEPFNNQGTIYSQLPYDEMEVYAEENHFQYQTDSNSHDFEQIYYEEFLNAVYEEINKAPDTDNIDNSNTNGNNSNGDEIMELSQNVRHFRCECMQCIGCDCWTMSSFNYMTTHLSFADIKVDLLNANSFQLTSDALSLFITSNEMESMSSLVDIIFHNNIRVLVRPNKEAALQDIDFVSKQYSITFRYNAVNFTSTSNLLTYSVERSGCKTKMCKLNSILRDDFVTKRFQSELGKIKNTPSGKSNSKLYSNNNKKMFIEKQNKQLESYQFKTNSDNQSLTSTIEDLQIIQQPSGNVYIYNEHNDLLLKLHNNQTSLCIQIANICIILNKSGNLFVGQKLAYNKKSTTGTNNFVNNGSGINESGDNYQDIGNCPGSLYDSNVLFQANFDFNRVMLDSFDRYAIIGIGGLLVKHHSRRAGLNQKNQICLL